MRPQVGPETTLRRGPKLARDKEEEEEEEVEVPLQLQVPMPPLAPFIKKKRVALFLISYTQAVDSFRAVNPS